MLALLCSGGCSAFVGVGQLSPLRRSPHGPLMQTLPSSGGSELEASNELGNTFWATLDGRDEDWRELNATELAAAIILSFERENWNGARLIATGRMCGAESPFACPGAMRPSPPLFCAALSSSACAPCRR